MATALTPHYIHFDMKNNPELTATELKTYLSFDAESGIFLWRERLSNRIPPSMKAGTIDKWGHRAIKIGQRLYRAHRLAWLYVYGVWPPCEIDHINGARDDNRIVNLRLSDARWQQRANQKKRKDSKNQFKGVKQSGSRWTARCTKNRVVTYMYGFRTPEEAHAAYLAMAQDKFGQFARAA